MDDLIAFLKARLTEDEQTAQRSETQHWRYVRVDDVTPDHSIEFGERVCIDIGMTGDDFMRPGEARHAARHDPARVLREVEARRQRIEHYLKVCELADPNRNPAQEYVLAKGAAEKSLMFDALPHADHPGFREEWRP